VEAVGKLATSRQIPPTRTIVGGKLNMEDIGTSRYPKGQSVTNRALLRAGLEGGDVMVFKATNTESSGRKAKFTAFETRQAKTVDEDNPTKRHATASSSSSATDPDSSPPWGKLGAIHTRHSSQFTLGTPGPVWYCRGPRNHDNNRGDFFKKPNRTTPCSHHICIDEFFLLGTKGPDLRAGHLRGVLRSRPHWAWWQP